MTDPRFTKLLDHLYRSGSFAHYWTPDATDENNKPAKLSQWFSADAPQPPLAAWQALNLYFSVHPNQRRRSIHEKVRVDDIEAINCLYADMDGKAFGGHGGAYAYVTGLQPSPSVVIDSGGGYHCYWLFDTPWRLETDNDRERARQLQYAWVEFVGSDDTVKDLARVLRVPGSFNTKYDPPRQVDFASCNMDRLYTLEELEALVASIVQRQQAQPTNVHIPPGVVDMDDRELIEKAQAAQGGAKFSRLWAGDTADAGGDHSKADLALCNMLAFWTGRDRDRMDRLFRQSGLMRPKWERDDYRDGTLDQAINGTQTTYSPNGSSSQAVKAAQSAVGLGKNQAQQQSSVTGRSFEDLLIDLAAQADATMWALDHVGEIAKLDLVERLKILVELRKAGMTARFEARLEKAINQVIKGDKNRVANSVPPSVGGVAGQSAPPSIFLTETADHEGNAQCVYHFHGENFRHCGEIGWLYYNGRYWSAENAEAYLDRAIVDILLQRRLAAVHAQQETIVRKTEASSYNVAGTKKLFRSLVVISLSSFDADPEQLNCANGVVNLRTGLLQVHSSDQLFTYCLPVDYDPQADYVDWVEFLHQVLPSPTLADYLQMAMGYSASGYTNEECLFYVHGPTRSGKGTFSETLLSLLSKPLSVQADFSTFTAKREGDTQNFDLAPLKPARFIVASESNKYDTLNEAKIKAATGGDWIRCSYKHRDHFEYRPQFKIWLVSNHPVSGDVDDAAFWGRIRVIEFPNSYLGKEDKELKGRMKTETNLRGVLAWLVEGAMRWFAAPNGLPIPDEIETATQKARQDLDYVQQWLDECCDVDMTGNTWTINKVVYKSYQDWCVDNGINPKGTRHFGRALAAKGFDVSVQKRMKNGKRARGIGGITII